MQFVKDADIKNEFAKKFGSIFFRMVAAATDKIEKVCYNIY